MAVATKGNAEASALISAIEMKRPLVGLSAGESQADDGHKMFSGDGRAPTAGSKVKTKKQSAMNRLNLPRFSNALRRLLGAFLLLIALLLVPARVNAETLNYHLPKFDTVNKPRLVLGPAGEHFTFLRTGDDTNGLFSMASAIIPPGAGPLPHVHTLTDEWFYFPKGGITIFCDTNTKYSSLNKIPNRNGVPAANAQSIVTKDNSLYYGPHDYLHGFYNSTDHDLEVTFVWAARPSETKNPAANISDYFFTVGRTVQAFEPGMQATDAEKAAFSADAPRWGINQSNYFMQYLNSITPAGKHSMFVMEDDQVARLSKLLRTPLMRRSK